MLLVLLLLRVRLRVLVLRVVLLLLCRSKRLLWVPFSRSGFDLMSRR